MSHPDKHIENRPSIVGVRLPINDHTKRMILLLVKGWKLELGFDWFVGELVDTIKQKRPVGS